MLSLQQAEKIVIQNIPEHLIKFAQEFIKNNYEVFLVGGIIRDILLGIDFKNKEIDLATSAKPEEVKKIFKKGVIPTGIKHGTVTVIRDGIHYEVTTFRKEGKYSDRRRPDKIEYAKSIEEDLGRRDFTINALAFDLKNFKLIDLFNGLKHLEEKLIITIGNPDDRFQEDALRIIRAIRFATTLNFKIEEKVWRSICKNSELLKVIAIERIREEFEKIITADKPSTGIELLRKAGILRFLMPELLMGFGIKQNKYHKYDIYTHLLLACDFAPKDNKVVRLAALFHDIGKPPAREIPEGKTVEDATFYNHEVIGAGITKKVLKRMRFSNEIVEKVTTLVRYHMFYYTDEWTDSAVRRLIRRVGLERLDDLFALRKADRLATGIRKERSISLEKLKERIEKILEQENAFSVKDLKVNGYDVMKIKNIPPSPLVGKILNYLLEKCLDDPSLNTRENLIKLIKEYKIEES